MILSDKLDRHGKITPLLIFLSVLIIYLAFPTKNYYWDGIEFALTIEEAPSLIPQLLHPNHLIYDIVGYFFYHLALSFFPSIRAIEVLQTISSFFGAASVAVFYIILQKILRREYLSISLVALLAFSATWWRFSTDGGSYVPSVFFLLVSFYLILPDEKPRPFLTAATHTLAMFFHQLAVLFFPVVIIGIILQTASSATRGRIFKLLEYALTAFVLTFGAYLLGFYWLHGMFDWTVFYKWTTWYSPEIGFVFSPANVLNALIKSHAKLVFEGKFKALRIEFVDLAFLGLLIFSVALLVYKIVRNSNFFGIVRRAVGNRKFYAASIFKLCLAWLAPYFLFLSFFIPGNTFYKLFYVPPVLVLIGLAGRAVVGENQIGRWRLALLTLIVFLANFIFYVHPSARVRPDSPLALAFDMNRRWKDKSVIFYDAFNTDTRLVRYFNMNTVWIRFSSMEDFENRLQNSAAQNETIWIDDTALRRFESSPDAREKFSEIAVEKERDNINDPAHDIKFIRVEPKF